VGFFKAPAIGVVYELRHDKGRISRICDESTDALVLKSLKKDKGVTKNCMTLFMDDPKERQM